MCVEAANIAPLCASPPSSMAYKRLAGHSWMQLVRRRCLAEKTREIQVGRLDQWMPMKKRLRPGPGTETNGERVGRICSVMKFGCMAAVFLEVCHLAISYSLLQLCMTVWCSSTAMYLDYLSFCISCPSPDTSQRHRPSAQTKWWVHGAW